ncbi:class I SAM-dependent methyltransferase [Cytobacillus sp. IB215665]|uniref:class I SAM-dependent methyltransferase n=1 Tax=Cytobacillus sp. IB215665 TaxID=3097357 RepID=UPI002A0FA4A6|nr:methyltransferase domain-containing protein [Cytobacillus sp. IB215665]MDX8365354.1 methyltransferase domain-containing protein [Cytobacillus sp. IB215665]
MEKHLTSNNFEEYDDANLYDMENTFLNDIPFLTKWASKQHGMIIDLACGTGRATIPLAKKGYKLIGVDIYKSMLEQARNKANNQNLHIEWVEQDCTQLNLSEVGSMVYMVGNGFQHFLTNEAQNHLLTSVNRHLEHDGIFIFDTRFPSVEELLQPSTEEYWRTYTRNDGKIVDVSTISTYDALNQLQHYTTIRKVKNEQGIKIDETSTQITLRYVFPKEMERLLSDSGFEILHIFKDWNEAPITNDSYSMIFVCRKVK